MSGTRFARTTGRCRFLICFAILILMVGMVAIFHSSQIQLDETRSERLHCEQQQETLNERLTSLVEQKFHLEKNQERERTEYLESKRNLEQKIKDLEDRHQKEQVETQMQYDKLQQAHKLLQSKHTELKDENLKNNKQHLENINGLENKLQSLKSELAKEKSNKSGEIYMWKEKYNTAEQEKSRLEGLFSATDTHQQLEHMKDLEIQLKECKASELSRKPPVAKKPELSVNSNLGTSQKTFKLQEPVSDGVYHIAVNISNKNNNDTKKISHANVGDGDGAGGNGGRLNEPSSVIEHEGLDDNKKQKPTTKQDKQIADTNPVFKPLITKHYNGSLILNSVENFQIVPKPMKRLPEEESQMDQQPVESAKEHPVAPLGAPKHKSSTPTTKSEQQISSALNATTGNTRTGRDNGSSTSNSLLPPNQKKLPANVAPYPNFEDLLQKSNNEQSKNNAVDEGSNNGNAIVGNEAKVSALKSPNNNNYDFGAHEENINDDSNFNHDEDIHNFFDTDDSPKDNHRQQKGGDDDDDGGLLGADNDNADGGAAGDIAVKHNQLLDVNLKNEIADDQGKEKEFGDGLRLDEGAMEEDDEDDDYSNPSARKKADKAVRH